MRSFDKKCEVIIVFLGSMNETWKAVKADTGLMQDKQDETISEIAGVRTDKSYMAEKFTRIEQDVEALKAKLGLV